jgi:DNA polymerase-3 subunit delta'
MAGVSRNTAILEALKRARAENRLHHAYILSGPEGGAKLDCVEKFAAEVFAEGGGGLFGAGGNAEASLRRIRQRNHPDFTVIQPVNETIGVDEIRELPRLLAFPPLEAPRRIVLITGAAGMNTQASNALLKILEEPPGHTMFFLLCRDPAELLPTIISRCQALRFAPMNREELREALRQKAQLDAGQKAQLDSGQEAGLDSGQEAGLDSKTDLDSVIAYSEGSLARAQALLAGEEGLALRRAAAENLLALWEASPRVPSAAAHWVETLGEDGAPVVIDSWSQLLRDLLFTLSGAPASDLLFADFYPRLRALTQGQGDRLWEEASAKSAVINRFRVHRDFNGNLRLGLASLLADLQIISVGKRA